MKQPSAVPNPQQLAAGNKTINDYGKATPLAIATPTTNLLQNLRKGSNGNR